MQREMSTSFAYSGLRRMPGAGSGDAEMRLIARLPRWDVRHQTASMLTRKALNSGQLVFASPTKGVSEFAMEPVVMPLKPQCTGMPTVQSV